MRHYVIPANFTDAGRLFGLFEVRNGVEAVAVSVPLLMLCFAWLPFSLMTNLIITMILVIPAGGFALIGINDDCLTRFLRTWLVWRRRRGILLHRGNARLKNRRAKQFHEH